MKKNFVHIVSACIGLILFSIALFVIHSELKTYHYHDIVKALVTIPQKATLLAILFTAVNFLVLGTYEILGFKYINKKLPWHKTLFTSFVAFSFSNNIGFYSISGSAVRYRLYSQYSLSTLDIAKLIAFSSGIAFWLGMCSICALVFITQPLALPEVLHLPFSSTHFIGWFFLIPVLGFLTLTIVWKNPIKIRSWEFEPPSPGLTVALLLIACLDWISLAAVLYCLMPFLHISFPLFLSIFLTAQVIALISHVPGGLGVFESIILLLLPEVPAVDCVGALVVYRAVYYLLPLGIAGFLLAGRELLRHKKLIGNIALNFSQLGSSVVPAIYSAMSFIGGVILLVSGVTPVAHNRMHWLAHIVPLPVLEISHFMASLFGVALLVLARGLYRRFDSAWHITLYFLAGGAIFTFLKGLDYEEASILAIMFLVFLPNRRHFYRKASFIHDRFSFNWFIVVVLVIASATWLGFFSYKHIAYTNQLWWQFGFNSHASRFLRASVGACIALFAFGMYRLVSPTRKPNLPGAAVALDTIRPIIAHSSTSTAFLSFLGDKSFLLGETSDAFIMYGVQGRTWVAMGDPIGNKQAFQSLIWDFKELCDVNGGRLVFYEVGKHNLHYYLDIGLTLLKIGEEARVDLNSFSMDGGSKKGLRYTMKKLEQEGIIFSILSPHEVAPRLGDLKIVSDDWLVNKAAREKRFSLGKFLPAYLKETPVATVLKDGKIVAFANLWPTSNKEELSIDLMRYCLEAPKGVMEFLFVNMLLWGKNQGFQWFNLGMAPFSGLDNRTIAPIWNRFGAYIFTHGEEFYNFKGVRQYKDKFDPVWEPKYLAVPGGFSLPLILKDISSLISGKPKGAEKLVSTSLASEIIKKEHNA